VATSFWLSLSFLRWSLINIAKAYVEVINIVSINPKIDTL
jgi:hypothetical protein